MSLESNINQLIRPHVSYNRIGKIVTAQPLLTQLTDFIGATGNSASNERPIPGSIKALSTHVQMEWDARNHQYEITGDDSGGLWSILKYWDAFIANTGSDTEQFLEHVTQDWIDEIKNVIDPPRARRPLRQPCAACGCRWHYDHDGKRSETLTAWVWDSKGEQVIPAEHWDVQCASCGAEWRGKEVEKAYWKTMK